MNKFTFDKKEQKLLEVEINGKVYKCNPYSLTVTKACEKFTTCQKPVVNRLNLLKSKYGNKIPQKELTDIVLKACNLVRDTMNQIFGKGSYERIFAGRTVDFYEHQKLIQFALDEITTFVKENPVNILNNDKPLA